MSPQHTAGETFVSVYNQEVPLSVVRLTSFQYSIALRTQQISDKAEKFTVGQCLYTPQYSVSRAATLERFG